MWYLKDLSLQIAIFFPLNFICPQTAISRIIGQQKPECLESGVSTYRTVIREASHNCLRLSHMRSI